MKNVIVILQEANESMYVVCN